MIAQTSQEVKQTLRKEDQAIDLISKMARLQSVFEKLKALNAEILKEVRKR